MNSYGNIRGFSLIELLVTVAIVGVLATIAYPSYRTQVEQSRRAEMQGELMALSQFFERVYSRAGCYNPGADEDYDCNTGTAGAISFNDDLQYENNERFEYYDVEIVAGSLTLSTYELKATPKGAQAGTGALYIDHVGRRYWDENDDNDHDDTGEDNWHRG